MTSRQVISSPFFSSRSRISPTLLRSLLVRGSGIQIDDTLRRLGWDGSSAVATPVLTVGVELGRVSGARFETRGHGPEVKFNAADLWEGVTTGVLVTVKLDNMSMVQWRSEGIGRNQSEWMEGDEVNVRYERTTGEEMDDEELDDAGVGKFALRLTLLPTNVSKMALYGGIVPMTKEELREKVEACDAEIDSELVPTIALKLGWAKGKPLNGYLVDLMPHEREEDKVGLGVLPLLETIGSSNPSLPNHEDLEEQLCLLLRAVVATNNVNREIFRLAPLAPFASCGLSPGVR